MSSHQNPIGFLIVDVARLMRLSFDRALAVAGVGGLTPGEARALAHVDRCGAVRQTLLAQRMAIEPMTLVGYLDRLEAQGLVAREPDPTDRRAKIVRLTPGAEPVLARILEVGREVRAVALAGMSEAEADQFLALLERAHRNLASGRDGADDVENAT